MKTLTEQYIEKLEGLILNLKIGFVSKTVSSLTLEVIERLESDIAALKANMEQEEHETCDGCKMFINNLCMLDVSVCPDCFERSQWTAQKQKKQKPEAKITRLNLLKSDEFWEEVIQNGLYNKKNHKKLIQLMITYKNELIQLFNQ